ncbi:hypothetical protein I3842_05G168100 [Carya illinoinensis]|uniref:Uncharacterized protein n=1 Tax=Carya illinoinensis TaxID=32201 RepID=A0A922F5Q9_CARIL|nr:hypothetical protein I3842_05G168100 [Carya illinoinensis]
MGLLGFLVLPSIVSTIVDDQNYGAWMRCFKHSRISKVFMSNGKFY